MSVGHPLTLLETLKALPRTKLAFTPTPLLHAPALGKALGTEAQIVLKMDAWTGLGLGGNKVRKLEFELSPNRLLGVTRLITAGGPHSNHCRVTAAAAAHLGLSCTLVINGKPDDPTRGNAKLHRQFGANIVTVKDRGDRDPTMELVAKEEAARGGSGLVIPIGASTPRGSLGYAIAFAELYEQVQGLAPKGDPLQSNRIVVSSSSGGTLAGLILGSALTGWYPKVLASSADTPAKELLSVATTLASEALLLLDPGPNHTPITTEHVQVTDSFVGAGYGMVTPETEEATDLFGRYGAALLDPFYTAKAGAALVDLVRGGTLGAADRIVFLHTGGHPALFQ